MAELHVIGQLCGAKGFPEASLSCKWSLSAGGGWKRLSGEVEGQTQTDCPEVGQMANWSHPIDVHYATKGIQGWPKIYLEVWHQDSFGRVDLYGYGFCHIPAPGFHKVEVAIWRPVGSLREQMTQKLLGGAPVLRNRDLVLSSTTDRSRLITESMGHVIIELNVIGRNFAAHGVQMY